MIKKIDCPFCGPKGDLDYVKCPEDDCYHVVCIDCGCCGPAGKSISEALEAWNKRS